MLGIPTQDRAPDYYRTPNYTGAFNENKYPQYSFYKKYILENKIGGEAFDKALHNPVESDKAVAAALIIHNERPEAITVTRQQAASIIKKAKELLPDLIKHVPDWVFKGDSEEKSKGEKVVSKAIETEESLVVKFDIEKLKSLGLKPDYQKAIESRFKEIQICINNGIPIAAIVMIGSVLEGVLFNLAMKKPKQFNKADSSPKNKDGKVLPFNEWTLRYLINVSSELGHTPKDLKEYCGILRNYRNYIHIPKSIKENFDPTMSTAKINYNTLCNIISHLSQEDLTKDIK